MTAGTPQRTDRSAASVHGAGFAQVDGGLGHPPEKFARVFARARATGFHLVAHAGQEGPPDYVRHALDLLHVERIDHGNRVLEDLALVRRLADAAIVLTVCPLSNLRFGGVPSIDAHPLRRMIEPA